MSHVSLDVCAAGGGGSDGEVLNICDDDPPEKAVAVRVATMLVKGGAKSPKLVSGLSQEEIEAMYCYGALDMPNWC